MLNALWKRLAARVTAQLAIPDPEAVEQLAERVTALEELQARRELEWADTRDRMLAYLRRVEGRAARDKQLAERDADPMTAARRTAVAMKFPRNNGA